MNTSRSSGSPRPMPVSPAWGKMSSPRVPTFPPRPPPTQTLPPSHPGHPGHSRPPHTPAFLVHAPHDLTRHSVTSRDALNALPALSLCPESSTF